MVRVFIVQHDDDEDYGTETQDQEPKDDLDSPSGCHEDGKLGSDSVVLECQSVSKQIWFNHVPYY